MKKAENQKFQNLNFLSSESSDQLKTEDSLKHGEIKDLSNDFATDLKSVLSDNPDKKIAGFRSTTGLETKLKELRDLEPDEKVEFVLSPDVSFYFFLSQLASPKLDFEYSGAYNPFTRYILMQRGLAANNNLSRNSVTPIAPRIEETDGKRHTVDVLFHTHPCKKDDNRWNCQPSPEDKSSLLFLKLLESTHSINRDGPAYSLIASDDCISVNSLDKLSLDDKQLLEIGLTPENLDWLKGQLLIIPRLAYLSYAKNEVSKKPFLDLIEAYFKARLEPDFNIDESLKKISQAILPYLRESYNSRRYNSAVEDFVTFLIQDFPKLPSETELLHKGFTKPQIDLINEMLIKTSTYQVINGKGLKVFEK